MSNRFYKGDLVFVYGYGEKNGKLYKNVKGKIIERDPYYKDYHVKLNDGTEDWFLPEDIRLPYYKSKKRRKRSKNNEN